MGVGKLIIAVNMFFQVLSTLIVLYAIFSWFCPPGSKLYDVYVKMGDLVEPLVRPWRRLTQGLAYRTGLDFAPLVAIFALEIVNAFIVMMLRFFLY